MSAERTERTGGGQRLRHGDIELDVDGRQVHVRGRAVPIRRREFDLLHVLMAHAGVILDAATLLREVWGESVDPATTKTLKAHMTRVRAHLESAGASGDSIRTVRGAGYVFELPAVSTPGPERSAPQDPDGSQLTVSGVELNLDGVQLRRGLARAELTVTELRFLQVLMERAGQVVSQEHIIEAVWGPGGGGDLSAYLRRARQRLQDVGADPGLIRTVRGMGYVFDVVGP